ncbi:MAG: GTPase HflX [Enterocloster sp.]|nr:GTPase HflX [Enterocloster sp.]
MELYELKEEQERVVLVGVQTQDGDDTEESLKELEELVKTAGAVSVGTVIQSREAIHPGYYVGTGKLEEIRMAADAYHATGIVCDDELSPSQMNNLERELGLKIMDRTVVILDIFAARANTSEGKIQVELAQLRYRAARLTGLGTSMSRLGGGIGTRGPGEKKLEMDRRLIKARISQLKKELEDVKRHREVTRQQRGKDYALTAAIVGYTNAGKSTLLNRLTGAGILAEDKLFATLDPTTRSFTLADGQQILLTDTVGFINKLPHHLVEAFKSTLEEARYCDIVLNVVDCSDPQMDMHMHVVKETLRELGITDKTVVTVFNKTDKLEESGLPIPRDFSADYQVRISAKCGDGLHELEEILGNIIRSRRVYLEKVYPYTQAGKLQSIRKYGQLLSEEYTEEGIKVTAYVPAELFAGLYTDIPEK